MENRSCSGHWRCSNAAQESDRRFDCTQRRVAAPPSENIDCDRRACLSEKHKQLECYTRFKQGWAPFFDPRAPRYGYVPYQCSKNPLPVWFHFWHYLREVCPYIQLNVNGGVIAGECTFKSMISRTQVIFLNRQIKDPDGFSVGNEIY